MVEGFKLRVRALIALAAVLACGDAVGVTVTFPDPCGGGVTASNATLATTNPNGDVTVSGTSAPYSVLYGCDPNPPATPSCSLSASQTRIAPGATTTLFAKCSSTPTSYTWNKPSDGPSLPVGSGGLNSFPLTFPSAGAYTYSISAANSSGQGPVSNQVAILVGDATTPPVCTLTASPILVLQGAKSTLQTSCNPTPSTYAWTTDAGAPPAPTGAAGELTFTSPGTFTYKVRGTLAGSGTGPAASATVSVLGPLAATETFTPSAIAPGGSSVLQITLTNSSTIAATGVGFTSSYPPNLFNAAAANATSTCGGTVTAANNGTSLALSGGSVAASGNCTVSVNVTSSVGGSYNHSSGPITTANMGTSSAASAALVVTSTPQYRASAGYEVLNTTTLPFPSTVSTDWLVLYTVSTANTVSTPPGWTLSAYWVWPTYGYYSFVFTRQVGTDSNVTVNISLGAALIVAYQNVSGIGAVGAFTQSADSATTIQGASITPQSANSLVVGIASDRDAQNPTPPAGYSSRISFKSTYFGQNISDKAYGSTAPTGSAIWSRGSANYGAVGILIELKP